MQIIGFTLFIMLGTSSHSTVLTEQNFESKAQCFQASKLIAENLFGSTIYFDVGNQESEWATNRWADHRYTVSCIPRVHTADSDRDGARKNLR